MFHFPTPALQDNYIWVIGPGRLGDAAGGSASAAPPTPVLVVDPGESEPVIQRLQDLNLTLHAILVTHHHGDHIDGIAALLARWPQALLCSAWPDRCRLEGLLTDWRDRVVTPHPGQRLPSACALGLDIEVLAVPGHTLDHLAYGVRDPASEADAPLLLCGDTLFSAGCGRMFEGTPPVFERSLARLAALPDSTRVACAHEYTLSNLRFAAAVEPLNTDITQHTAWAKAQRDLGQPTVGTELRLEKRINPFLRLNEPAVIDAARREGAESDDAVAVFAALRAWKNRF